MKTYKEQYREAIAELEDYRKCKLHSKGLEDRLRALRSKLVYPSHKDNLGVQKSRESYYREELIDTIIELEKDLSTNIVFSEARATDILNKINDVKYPYCQVLQYYYIDGMTFEKIAVKMNYCFRNVQYLHRVGVRLYSKLPALKGRYTKLLLKNIKTKMQEEKSKN